MKNCINISRLGKLFLMEIRLHRKNYLMLNAVIFAVLAIRIAYLYFLKGGDADLHFFFFRGFSDGIIFCTPFILYDFVYHPTKGLTHAMLPATSTEKVLSAWIQCVIVVPVLVYATLLLSAFLADLADVAVKWQTHLENRTFFEKYLYIIASQSLAFWGVFWFKHKKVAKTILTLALIGLGIATISMLIAKGLSNYSFSGAVITGNAEGLILFDGKYFIPYSSLKTLRYLAFLVAPILPWTLAFFKFRRTQI